jgi:DNA-binding NarL/FixJ family response regulator/DNA polymerase III delta prime subunit
MTLVGRDVEIAALRGVLEELAHGRGRGVLIEGEPGSGKSALLETLLRDAECTAECTVRAASCVEADGRTPLAALLRALRSDTPDSTAEALAVGRILALVDELCARGPLVLSVDDLHAADEASLLVWQRLCAVAAHSPLLLVGTFRPVPRRPEIDRIRVLLRDNDGVTLALDRLPPGAVAELAGRLLGAAPGPQLAARLESAGGNPHLVRGLVAAGSAQGVDALAASVADRLGFLDEAVREVLRTAALLGAEFSVTELSAVLRRPAGSLATAVHEALAGGVLDPVGPRLRFRHGLLRQALRESTSGPVRAAMQLIAIRALMDSGAPVERVAELIAEDPAIADGWETPWVARHAESLARRAPDLAADIFEHVLGRPGTAAPERAALLDGLATLSFTLYGLGRRGEAERLGARIEAEPGLAPVWRARLAARAARTREDAIRALAEGELLADPMTIGYARAAEAVLLFRAADPTACLDAVERALRAIGPPPRLPDCRSVLADIRSAAGADLAYREGRWDDALAEIDSVTDRAQLYGLAAVIALHRNDERTANASLKALSDLDPYALVARAAYAERANRPDEARDLISQVAAARPGASVSVRLGLVDADAQQLAAEVERLRAADRPAELGQALEELAVHRAREGDEAGARQASAEALARYAELGAAWDARRTAARLRAHGVRTGGRIGRRPSTGPRALTESELRVAEFLGGGMSNPDIAAELSLSRRTVESHVSRILAKLGVRTRREAAEVLRRE